MKRTSRLGNINESIPMSFSTWSKSVSSVDKSGGALFGDGKSREEARGACQQPSTQTAEPAAQCTDTRMEL